MRLPVDRSLPLAALILLTACAGGPPVEDAPPAASARSGPAGDYPMVLGSPFTIDGQTYTPADTMNYDAVGRALLGNAGGQGITAAHRTLPLPSYVEVTALDSGRTILVRVERRGPMAGRYAIELSPGAAAQLGVSGGQVPVRVRRVNPPEPERAVLRAGGQAPARMDTPRSLLDVLNRRLDPPAKAAAVPVAVPSPQPAPAPVTLPKPAPTPKPAVAVKPPVAKPPPPPSAVTAKPFVVQLGAYADKARAEAAAKRGGGTVSAAGKVWRVRAGPFATRAEAEAALAKARAAGYGDARIQPAS